jgi:hypothetical protein
MEEESISSSSDSEASSVSLDNPTDDVTESQRKLQGTVSKHFQEYISYHNKKNKENQLQYGTLQQLMERTPEVLTKDFLGCFGSYLQKKKNFRNLGTVLGYMSGLRGILESGLGDTHIIFQGKWFKNLRTSLEKRYKKEGEGKKKFMFLIVIYVSHLYFSFLALLCLRMPDRQHFQMLDVEFHLLNNGFLFYYVKLPSTTAWKSFGLI